MVNFQFTVPQDKPLVVMLTWLMAKKKHIYKYANFYVDRGFDVLNVTITPWQLLWPTKGSQVFIANFNDALYKLFHMNRRFSGRRCRHIKISRRE